MNDFVNAPYTAARLIARLDPELREIVVLSLSVSLTASICAFLIGSPLGTALAVYRFWGRGAAIVSPTRFVGKRGRQLRGDPSARCEDGMFSLSGL
jgi:tungstate transport system permease protein